MGTVSEREFRAFPPGDNSSDTLIDSVHWNLTTLNRLNYTNYSNGTLSNGSHCFLIFKPYTPHLLPNGTFLNSTSCYSPVRPMGKRSILGLIYGCFFGASIAFTLVNLRKHGTLFLPIEKRFRAVGRRWQWYWMLIVAAFALISAITGIDVDRYYLPELPIVLTNFFWYLMIPSTLCVVWESVRNWGSWQERQMVDADPLILKQGDRRSLVEFFLPLVFYLFFWLNFFMVVPRPWGRIELQRDVNQSRLRAAPSATDIRFKAAAFFLLAGWLVIMFSLQHSIKHYKLRKGGPSRLIYGFIRYAPMKFKLSLTLSLAMIGYNALCAFDFAFSPLYVDCSLAYIYGLGWGTVALIFMVYEVAGLVDPNEDLALIRQRRTRLAEIESEIGIMKKPHWWSRIHGSTAVDEQTTRNLNGFGTRRLKDENLEISVKMRNMTANPVGSDLSINYLSGEFWDGCQFSNHLAPSKRAAEVDASKITVEEGGESDNGGTVTLAAQRQVVRSMLDI